MFLVDLVREMRFVFDRADIFLFSFKPGLTIHIFLSIIQPNGDLIVGALGPDNGGLKVEEGYEAARHCGLNIIATLKEQLGDLDRVEQVVKVRVA